VMRRFKVKEVDKLPDFNDARLKRRHHLDQINGKHFYRDNFENMMRNRGITTLIFTGIATELGIESSARDVSNRGFYPVVISDCVSSMDRDAHERSLKNFDKTAVVRNSAEILENIAL
jgi:nicotinamidase-related amidase